MRTLRESRRHAIPPPDFSPPLPEIARAAYAAAGPAATVVTELRLQRRFDRPLAAKPSHTSTVRRYHRDTMQVASLLMSAPAVRAPHVPVPTAAFRPL